MDLKQARKQLDQFSCIEQKTVDTEEEKEQLKTALQTIVKESEWENLGICADNTQQAINAVKSYLTAFGYDIEQVNFDQTQLLDHPVYIKFSTKQMGFYQDNYTGDYRGVLVSCQAEDDLVAGTYGHLPLDLFCLLD
ncbi:DUF1824 family protein [Euhalothece natronophila Z-M001]|uniref:DUF1824 family protein n=2 Tax=Euhalothece TaxID=65097 RepID=A0A5B8NQR0_9CHRO|nr:DUF1824 family protein [Euhalothece natronophila Z-M001]